MADKIYVSRAGLQKMNDERKELLARRPKISAAILEAREKGDLKENAEYHAAKEELAHVQARIAELENKIGQAHVLEDQGDIPTDKAYIGATVHVKDDTGAPMTFILVDSSESDPTQGKVSVTSPIGQALLGQSIGAKVKVPVGKSGYFLTIEKIERN